MQSNKQIMRDYGHTIRNKLIEGVNGKVTFDCVPEGDLIIINILFKDFKFRYVVTDVSGSIYNGSSNEVVQSIERRYRHSILDAFFRTEANKERLEKMRLGLPDEEVIM